MTPELIRLFRKMADLTEPECASVCKLPRSCCSPEYCDMAEETARDHGVVLTPTDHPTLKFMTPTGCIVEPHWRPLCTLHTCAFNNMGFKLNDEAWNKKYFKLREKIDLEMFNER